MQTDLQLSETELEFRMRKFQQKMNQIYPDWEMAVITSEMNQYYFTGTIQRGMLIIRREGESVLWVRRSYERAILESRFAHIREMTSFRSAVADYPDLPKTVYLEKNQVTINWYEMFSKYFHFESVIGIDRLLQSVRSLKTDYEIYQQKEAGRRHRILTEERVPCLLKEGISEVELVGEIFNEAIRLGHHGLSRFSGNNGDMYMGYVAFSESGLYPTSFDGPGGIAGISPATPYLGSTTRKLKKGDIVLVDFGFGYHGYSTDKTSLYSFGAKPEQIVSDTFSQCAEIMWKTAELMKPGAVPAKIYETIMADTPDTIKRGLMGYKDRTVKFLGHGIGLHIDEYPVIAIGFDEPLQANMTIALEPKKGIEGYGLIGTEETFLIETSGSVCITGERSRIIEV